MKTVISILFVLVIPVLFFFSFQSGAYTFSIDETSRILRVLSSDDMKGRQTFTPEIDKAADFIAREFDQIGLTPVPGQDDFFQRFTMEEIALEKALITFDDTEISENNFFGLFKSAVVRFDHRSGITTQYITADQDFRSAFNTYRDSEEDLLIVVDKSHESIFRRYQPFFSRPTRDFEVTGGNLIFVLARSKPRTYSVDITTRKTELTLNNVTGFIPGKRTDEIVLFSAHYDHIGILKPVEGDSIANGANDNGSGVTSVIELARYFKSRNKPERSIYFALFTAEELGGFGSRYFSKQLDPDQVVAMFNIEMTGKPAVSGPNSAWVTGFERSTFGSILQESAKGTDFKFYPDPYPNQNLFFRSDNAALARLGVPAHTISTTPIDVDPDYHRVSDEFETIDLEHMTNTIRAIARAARGIIGGNDTPTRVDISTMN
ncbi:MAG: M20/M25/M40 family metallo-hydrolase [Bacteroidota bacterium]